MVMKHKQITHVLPYTYFLRNKHTNEKYYGVRYGNVNNNIAPIDDIGKKYFTSSKYINFHSENVGEWDIIIHYTFDSILEATEYETKFLNKVFKRGDWINRTNNRCIINSNESLKLISDKMRLIRSVKYWNNGLTTHTLESRNKISIANTGKMSHKKGKTNDELYGIEKSSIISRKMSNAAIGKVPWNKGVKQSTELLQKNPFIINNPSHNKKIVEKKAYMSKYRYIVLSDEFEHYIIGEKPLREFFAKMIKSKLNNIGYDKWINNLEHFGYSIKKLKLIDIKYGTEQLV